MKHTTGAQWLAITAGAAATVGAIGLLVSDAIGGHWTLDHSLTPLVVGLTVASGHLSAAAVRSRKPLAAFGFAVAFLMGTGVTVLNGVGRQTEGVETKMAQAQSANDAIKGKASDLALARQRLIEADAMVKKEMTGETCGRKCMDWKTRGKEVEARIEKLEGELKSLGGVRPVNAKATKAGEIAGVFGADAKRAATIVVLLEPMMIPFMLEWVAITALGFGFGHRKTAAVDAPAPVKQAIIEEAELPPDSELEKLRKLLQLLQEPVKNKDLAAKAGVSESEMSKWTNKGVEAGIVSKVRAGRGIAISLAPTSYAIN